jgi:hypothetical protein
MTDRQLLQQALDALQGLADYRYTKPVETTMKALNERLAHCDRCGKRLGGEGDIHTCTPDPIGDAQDKLIAEMAAQPDQEPVAEVVWGAKTDFEWQFKMFVELSCVEDVPVKLYAGPFKGAAMYWHDTEKDKGTTPPAAAQQVGGEVDEKSTKTQCLQGLEAGGEAPVQEPFSPEAIRATQTAWQMGYEAAKAEMQTEQKPVAWLHPANATCVTTDPTAYARGIPLYTNQPAAPMTEFEEAVAACDNTLHHAINHWQDRALKAEAKLAQPEQEPVAWMFQHGETGRMSFVSNDGMNNPELFLAMNPRYALVCALVTPPAAQRQWVDLTDDDLVACSDSQKATVFYFMKKLKEKNT